MLRHIFAAALVTAALAAAPAPAAEIAPGVPSCLPAGGNGVVSAILTPETGWSNVRVYFREAGTEPFYFLEMRSDGSGRYWASLPKPDPGTSTVDLYIVAMGTDAAEVRTAQTSLPVLSSCTPDLTPEQASYARNLVVGETAADQVGKAVLGFQCDGIVSRIEPDGELRSDDQCRRVMLAEAASGTAATAGKSAKWLVPVAVVGAAGVGAVIVSQEDEENPSPSTPQ